MRTSSPALIALTLAFLATSVVRAQFRPPSAEITPIAERERVAPGSSARLALQISLPEGFHVQSNAPRDASLIPTVLTIDAPAGLTVDEIVFPTPVDLKQVGADDPLAVFEQTFIVGVRVTVASSVTEGELAIPARLRYQACNDTTCFAPKNADAEWKVRVGAPSAAAHADIFNQIRFGIGNAGKALAAAPAAVPIPVGPAGPLTADQAVAALNDFTIEATTGGYLGRSDFLSFIHNAEHGVKNAGLDGRGPLAILLVVFLGGLALNLTPCVLPMIPINLAIIGAGAKAGSRGRGFLLGGVYGAAMALVYGVLGVVVILTAGSFGTINASPWFNLGIALLFIVLGLAMFDVFTIDFSRYSSGFSMRQRNRGTFLLAFSMGAIAALLAGACVAPVVIEVILFSSNLYAKGTSVALALPFLLGIGMAVPWPIAGAGIASLPKPGAWMVRVKQALGVIIFATAAYYAYETYGLFANRWVDSTAVTSSVQEKLKAGWHSSLIEGLATAKRENKPVLIDMWATWCKNCLTMDKTTLEEQTIISALEPYVKIKFQAEDPDQQPAKAVMRHVDAVGLPAYVILRPRTEPRP